MSRDERLRGFLAELEAVERIYIKLIELTENQGRVIASGVGDELVRLAESKSRELARLEDVESSLRERRRDLDAIRSQLDDAEKARVNETVARVEGVLRRLLELEEGERRSLNERRDDTLEQLRRVDRSRRMNKAYGGAQAPPAVALDQKE